MTHEGYSKKELAAKAATGVAAGAAVGATIYLLRKREQLKRELTFDESLADTYKTNLREVFAQPLLSQDKRQLMADIAVRVYHGGDNANMVITRKQLMADMGVAKGEFDEAVGYLRHYSLVGRERSKVNPRSHGYFAMPSLIWGIEYEKDPEVSGLLTETESEFINEQLGL